MTHIALEEMNFLWYPDEIEKFGELCKSKATIPQMAEELNRSEDEVIVLILDLKRYGMRDAEKTRAHEQWDRTIEKSQLDEEAIHNLYYNLNYTLQSIASVAGMTKDAISNYITSKRKKNPDKWPLKKASGKKGGKKT